MQDTEHKVLLTGGVGDLGQRVAPLLSSLGYSVVLMDIVGHTSQAAKMCAGDITDPRSVEDACSSVSTVVHIAALHGIHEFRGSHSDREFWETNVAGTFNVVQALRKCSVRNLIFISSTSVEEGESIYGASKLEAEALCRFYCARYGINLLILRPRAFIPHTNISVY